MPHNEKLKAIKMMLDQKKSVERLAYSPRASPKSDVTKLTLSTVKLGATQRLNSTALKSLTSSCLSEQDVFKLLVKNLGEAEVNEIMPQLA